MKIIFREVSDSASGARITGRGRFFRPRQSGAAGQKKEAVMKSQNQSEERALGYVATACYTFSLALCAVVAYAVVVLALPVFDKAGQTLYHTSMKF